MPDLYVSWTEYHSKIEALATQIYQSHWQFNQIICIAKGGLRIGDLLCRVYEKPLAIMFAASYSGAGNRIRGELTISPHLAMTSSKLGSKVLLVDDLVDSGVSMQRCVEWLESHYSQEIEEIRTGVIWYKANSQFRPDYYVDYLRDSPWIHQPFEYYESITIEELVQKNSQLLTK